MKLGRIAGALLAAGTAATVLGACVEDVGVPPGATGARANDVNEVGVAAVDAVVDGDRTAWTLAEDGTWTPLPSPRSDARHTSAAAVNGSGTVVGWTTADPSNLAHQAVLWQPDGTARLIPSEATWSQAVDVNDSGLVLAMGDRTPGSLSHAIVWDPTTGERTVLESAIPGHETYPAAIGEDGTVVGNTGSGRGDTLAVVWRAPAYEPELLGSPSSDPRDTFAADIDGDGTVVGYYTEWSGDARTGVRWSPTGQATPLGDFLPVGIDDGTLLGHPDVRGRPAAGALLWPPGATGPESLGTVDGGEVTATAIAGDEIVGYIARPDGTTHAARLTRNTP